MKRHIRVFFTSLFKPWPTSGCVTKGCSKSKLWWCDRRGQLTGGCFSWWWVTCWVWACKYWTSLWATCPPLSPTCHSPSHHLLSHPCMSPAPALLICSCKFLLHCSPLVNNTSLHNSYWQMSCTHNTIIMFIYRFVLFLLFYIKTHFSKNFYLLAHSSYKIYKSQPLLLPSIQIPSPYFSQHSLLTSFLCIIHYTIHPPLSSSSSLCKQAFHHCLPHSIHFQSSHKFPSRAFIFVIHPSIKILNSLGNITSTHIGKMHLDLLNCIILG